MRSTLLAALITAVFVLSGCIGNNARGQSGSQVSQTQANQVAQQTYLIVTDALEGEDTEHAISATYNCGLGGNVAVAGDSSTDGPATVTETLSGCAVSPVIFSGNLSGSLSAAQSFSSSGTNDTNSQSSGGYLSGVVNSSTGTCSVDLSFESQVTTTGSISMNSYMIYGTACGQPISLANFEFL